MDVVAEQYSVIIRGMANVIVLAWSITRIRSEDSLSALFTVLPIKKLPIRTLMTWFVLLSVLCAVAMDGLLARILYHEQYLFEWNGQQNTTVTPLDLASPTSSNLPSSSDTTFGPLLVSKPISSWEGSDTILSKAAWLLWALSLSFGLAPLIMLSSFWSAHIKELFHETNLITVFEFRTYFVYGFFSFLIGPIVYIVTGFVLGWNSATNITRLFFFSEGLLIIVLHITTLGRLLQLRRDSKLGGNRTVMTEKLGYFIDLDVKLLIAMIGIIVPLFLMLMVKLPNLSILAQRFLQDVLISIVTLSYVGYPAVLMLILYPRKIIWSGDISKDVIFEEADDKIYGMQTLPSQRPNNRYSSISEIVEAANRNSVSGPSSRIQEKARTSTFSTTVGNALGLEDIDGLQVYSSKRRSKRISDGPGQRSSGTSMKERFSGSRLASFVSQQKNNRPSDETEGSPLTMPPRPSTPSSPSSQFVAESPMGSPLRQRNGSMSVYQPMLWSPVPFDYIPTDSMSTIQSLPPVVTRGGVVPTSPRARNNNNPYSSPYSPRASSDLGSISESTDSRRISTTSTDQYLNRILGGQRPNPVTRKRDDGLDPYLSAILESRDSPNDTPVADEYLNNILGISVNKSAPRPTTGPAASALTAMNTQAAVESRQQNQQSQQPKEEKQPDSPDDVDPYLTHIRSSSIQDIITDVRAEIGSLRRSVVGIGASTPTDSNPPTSENHSARHSNLGRVSIASGVTESSLGFDTNNMAEWIHEYAGDGFDIDEFKEEMRVAQRNTTRSNQKSERRDSDISWVPPEPKDDPLRALQWEETSNPSSRAQSAQSRKRDSNVIGPVPPSRSNRGSKMSTPAHTPRGVTPTSNSGSNSSTNVANMTPGSEESFSKSSVQRPSELAKSSQRWSKAAKGYPFPEPESYRNSSPSQQSIQSMPEHISRIPEEETSYSSQKNPRYSLAPVSNNTYSSSSPALSQEPPSPLVSDFDDFDGYGSSYPEEFQYDEEDEEDIYRLSEGHIGYSENSSSTKISSSKIAEPTSYPPPNPQSLSSLPPPRRPYRNPLRTLSGSPTSEPIIVPPEIATAAPRDTFGETTRRSYYDDEEPLSPASEVSYAASEDTVRARSGPRIRVHTDDGDVTDFETRHSNGSYYGDDVDYDVSSAKRQSAFGDFGVRR